MPSRMNFRTPVCSIKLGNRSLFSIRYADTAKITGNSGADDAA
jgi:hypothetical protein